MIKVEQQGVVALFGGENPSSCIRVDQVLFWSNGVFPDNQNPKDRIVLEE